MLSNKKCMDMVGDRINEKLKEKGMTQKCLAEKIGVSTWAMSMWVNNKIMPNDENLSYIAMEFGCSVDYLKGTEEVPDRELKKNGSGYNDPTAYMAMKNLEKNTKEVIDVEINAGEIWKVEFGGKTEMVIVVKNHGAYSTILKLNSEYRCERTISLPVFGMKYAEPGFVSYKFHDAFDDYVRTLTEEEFDDVKQQIKYALGISDTVYESNSELADDLKMKLEGAERALNEEKAKFESEKLVCHALQKELEELKKQPVFPPDSEEVVRLKAQIEVLEKQNERLLDRLIG